MGTGFGGGREQKSKQGSNGYLEFIRKVLKAAGNISKIEDLYPILEANQDKLDDNFAQLLYHWGTVKLSDKGATQTKEIARNIGNFSNSLLNFPLGNRASNVEIAIAGTKLVLTVFTRWRFAEFWAMAQETLGAAYTNRIRGERSENIEQAIQCFTAALKVYTRSHFPQEWGDTQNNFGNAYIERIQGERAENIELAIHFFTEALQECSRSQFPQEWSKRQYNLGTAYVHRIRGEKGNNIEQAIYCFTQALQEHTCDRFPLEWAQTQTNLGSAYLARIQGERTKNIKQAIHYFTEAAKVYTQQSFPEQWATLQKNLYIAYSDRIQAEAVDQVEANTHFSSDAYLSFVFQVFDALQTSKGDAQVVNQLLQTNQDKLDYTLIQILQNWANDVLCKQDIEQKKITANQLVSFIHLLTKSFHLYSIDIHLEIAIVAVNIALTVFTRELFPSNWAKVKFRLGNIYFIQFQKNKTKNIEQAITAYHQALSVYTQEVFPKEWAEIHKLLGVSYMLCPQNNEAENQERGITAYHQALSVYTKEEFPEEWALIQFGLGNAYLKRIYGEQVKNIELAITAYHACLTIFNYQDSPDLWVNGQYFLGIAYSQRRIGNEADNIERAIVAWNQGLSVVKPDSSPQHWFHLQKFLFDAYCQRSIGDTAENIERAITAAKAVLSVFTYNVVFPQEWATFPQEWATFQSELGDIYLFKRILGNRSENIELGIASYRAALLVHTREAFPIEWAKIQVNLGIAYRQRILGNKIENLELGIAAYHAALSVYTREAFPNEWAIIQVNFGSTYFYRVLGDKAENIQQAITAGNLALSVFNREEFPVEWGAIQNNLGNAYIESIWGNKAENVELAITAFQAALSVRTRDRFGYHWSETQTNLGGAYIKRIVGDKAENIELGITAFQSALSVRTREAFPIEWAATQLNLGTAYLNRIQGNKAKNLEQAIAAINAALSIYTSDTFPIEWSMVQSVLGDAYRQKGQISEAIACFQSVLKISTPDKFPLECISAGESLGKIAFKAGMWSEAIQGYAAAIDAIEQIRTRASFEVRRHQIMNEAIGAYSCIVQACVNAGELAKAMEYVERSRSKRLVDLMASYNLSQGEDIPPKVQELLQQYEELQRQIDQERQSHKSENNRSETRAAGEAYNKAIASFETQKQQVWEQLRRLDSVLAGGIQVSAPKFSAIQKLIDQPTTAILSFYTTIHDTHIFVVRQNQITLHTCTGQGILQLQAWILENWSTPYLPRQFETKQDKAAREEIWYSRVSLILTELAERLQINDLISQHLQDIEELIFIPHVLLHEISFAALPIKNNQYLGDQFLIRYTPSCQILEFCQQRGAVETLYGTSLKYGTVEDAEDNLPCASFEGEKIAELYKIPLKRRLIGSSQATCNNYRQLIQQVQILHSCHHAQSRFDNPLESQLKLADGSITLGQLMTASWRLPNLSDVFLSCCETNLGNPSLSDDILTLSTGFLCAGARSVVSTLWAVNDLATALFSIFYYQHRKQGKSRPESLRQAQIKLRQLKKVDLTEISKQVELKRKEARNKRKQYLPDSAEYLECDREYRKYAGVTLEIVKNSTEEFPFSHPRYWGAFICQGLR